MTAARADLRILHVISTLNLGGTQNLLQRADRDLRSRGCYSRVCVLSGAEQVDDEYRETDPICLEFHGDYRSPLATSACVRRLCEVVDRERPDVLHSYMWTADFVSALAASRRRVCHLSQIVDRRDWLQSRRWIHALRRAGTRYAFRRAQTRFLAVSEAARQFAVDHLRIPADRTGVAYNGIDWSDYESATPVPVAADRPLVLGTAGRLELEKGHSFLIESVRQLLDAGHDVQLDVTGEGPLRSQLESQVSDLGIGDRVRFLGWVDDVRAFYRRIDAFIVPSRFAEGLPTTILEAMASGCVVVASDVGGAGEAVEDGVSGFVVPPEDVSALTSAVGRLCADRTQFAAIGAAARERIESGFTTRQMVDTMLDTYHAELTRRSRR